MDEVRAETVQRREFFSKRLLGIILAFTTVLAFASVSYRLLGQTETEITLTTSGEEASSLADNRPHGLEDWANSPEVIDSYSQRLMTSLDPKSACSEKMQSFMSVQDLLAFQASEFTKMANIEGDDSCLTFSGFPQSELDEAEQVVSSMMRSVVRLRVNKTSSGTGFVVGENLILTNYHVVADYSDVVYEDIQVETYNGTFLAARFVDGNFRSDVALVRTEEKIPGVVIAEISGSSPEIGEPVVSIGHPASTMPWTATVGVYYTSEPNIFNVESDVYSLPSISGASGSPIFNMQGKVVAMTYGSRELNFFDSEDTRFKLPLHKSVISAFVLSKAVQLENIKRYLE